MVSASAIDGAIQRKMRGQGVVRAGKGITLVISNEDMNYIIRIVKSLENSGVFVDEVSETVKHKIKKPEGGFLGMLLGTLGASVLGNMLTGKVVMRAERGYSNMDKIFSSAPSFKQS